MFPVSVTNSPPSSTRRIRCGFGKTEIPPAGGGEKPMVILGNGGPVDFCGSYIHTTSQPPTTSSSSASGSSNLSSSRRQKRNSSSGSVASGITMDETLLEQVQAQARTQEAEIMEQMNVQGTKSQQKQPQETTKINIQANTNKTAKSLLDGIWNDTLKKTFITRHETESTLGFSGTFDSTGVYSNDNNSDIDIDDNESDDNNDDESSWNDWWDKGTCPLDDMLSNKKFMRASDSSNNKNIRVQVEAFDLDHLNFLMDDGNSNDNECCNSNEGEIWIMKQLEKNASSLFWLQLTNEIEDPERMIKALYGNTSVRNVTIYPNIVFENLSKRQQQNLAEAICQLENLTNIIVFQDGGDIFVEPLSRYLPPLTRLTLYKLNFDNDKLLSQLTVLLQGLPALQELSIEKYYGSEADSLPLLMAEVLPSLTSLSKLSLTPTKQTVNNNITNSKEKSNNGQLIRLFQSLKHNDTVKTLSFQGIEEMIDQSCINQLVKSLQGNCTLQEIKLTGFWRSKDAFWKRFDLKSREQVNYLLTLNQLGIRNMQLDVNVTYEGLSNAIISHRDNVNHIFYLLSNNPCMLQTLLEKQQQQQQQQNIANDDDDIFHDFEMLLNM